MFLNGYLEPVVSEGGKELDGNLHRVLQTNHPQPPPYQGGGFLDSLLY
jgi:hypothetical protein